MTIETTDFIDFNVMHEPPTFVTTVRTDTGNTVIITSGTDFPGLVVEWPDALDEERAEDFWALGLLHLTEVEIVKLAPDARAEAVEKVKNLERHDPRGLGPKVAAIIREVTAPQPGVASTKFALSKVEMEAYRRLLIIRATGPYVGADDVTIVNIGSGVIAA